MTPEFTTPEPPAYFDGQRLTAADLAAAQDFQRELRWLHNRALHPTGIVEGLAVEGARDDVAVRVAPGFALDGLGRELLLGEPATVPVPPIAGAAGQPSRRRLTLRYDDEPVESRTGVCGTAGAVRRVERPLPRFRAAEDVDAVLDVVLADVLIGGCRLTAAPSLAARRVVSKAVAVVPRTAAGRTPEGSTSWQLYSDGAEVAGVETTVDTSAAAFDRVPVYQARVGGAREVQAGGARTTVTIADGPVVIADPTANSFVARMVLAGPVGRAGGMIVNPAAVRTAAFPPQATAELGWHVVWMGVEV